MRQRSSRSLAFSVCLYRLLVRAYPASFRERYASEMADLFRDMAEVAVERRGAIGLTTTWFRVLADLAWTAPQEHLIELRRGMEMKTAALAVCSIFLAFIVYLFVFAMTAMAFLIVGSLFSHSLLATYSHPVTELALVYLPAFLTGMILARVKPFLMPRVTAPLGAMAFGGLMAFGDGGVAWWAALGIVPSLGLVSLLGCIVATKVSRRLQRRRSPSEEHVPEPGRRIEVSRSSLLFACGVYLASFACLLAPAAWVHNVTMVGAWVLLAAVYLRWRLNTALIIHCLGPNAFALLALPLLLFTEGLLPPGTNRLAVAVNGLASGCWASMFFGFPVVAVIILFPHFGSRQRVANGTA